MECFCLHPERLRESHVHVTFARLATQQPGARCIIDWDGHVISYGQISSKAREISSLIEERLSTDGRHLDTTSPRIGVYMPRSALLVATILAIHHSECVYVPLDTDFPLERHKKCASIAGFSLVLFSSDGSLESEAHEICDASADPCECVCVMNRFLDGRGDDLLLPVEESTQRKDEAAYIIFTSGTTGEPKPVCYPHIGLIDAVHNHAERLNVDPDKDIFELSYSISFDAHVHPVLVPLICGASLAICKPHGHLDPAYWVDLVVRHSVTIVHTLPTLAVAYVAEMEKMTKDMSTIREWECMGENFPSNLASSLYRLLPNLSPRGCINGYGPTETFTVTHSFVRPEDTRISIGPPDPNVFCCVIDPETGAVITDVGVRGELIVSGPRVALGYLSDSTKTAERFVPNPAFDVIRDRIEEPWIQFYFERSYRTGDVVNWMKNGELELHGRIDRQVKIRGVRIELGEIESLLVSVDGVTGAAVDVRMCLGEKALVAWVTPKHIDTAFLYQICSERLVQAAVPASIVPLESFPVTSTGKVHVAALTVPEDASDDTMEEIDAEEVSAPIAIVRKFWKSALGLQVKDSSDFFALGGNSIKAFKINANIQSALGLLEPIPVTLLYKHRTLQDFARALEKFTEESNATENALTAHTWSDSKRPLGKFQEQMWTMASMAGKEAAGAYNLSLCFSISGKLDPDKLEGAFQTVVGRHEILRTVYHVKPDGTLSGQLAHGSIGLLRVSVANTQEFKRVMKSEMNHYFDLQSDFLLRVTLVSAEHTPDKQYLIIVTHHAVSDAWSLGILCDELSRAYKNETMHPLQCQYADYILWLARQSNRDHMTYWAEELKGIPERLDFPLDFPRPDVGGLEGTCAQFDILSRHQLIILSRLSSYIGISLNAILLAAFHVLLAKWSNSDDVVIGLPAAMRDIACTQNMIGYFISPLPIRGMLQKNESFGEFARRIHDKIMMGIKHGKLSFPEIVSAANVPSGSPFNPVFQVMFQFLDEEEPEVDFGGDIATSLCTLPDPGISQVDITFEVHAHDKSNVYLDVEYSTSILTASKIARLVDGYKTILDSICSDGVDMVLEEMNILSEAAKIEIDRLSRGAECLSYFEMPLLHDQFYAQVKQSPDSICLLCDQREHTYHQLLMMTYLTMENMRKGHPEGLEGKCIGVFASRSEELVISVLAIFFLGAIYLPLEPKLPEGRIAEYLSSSEAKLILVSAREDSEALHQTADELGVSTLFVSSDILKEHEMSSLETTENSHEMPADFESLRADSVTHKDRACILFTSGSTGKPKGVILTHGGLVDIVCGSYIDMFSTSKEDVFALATSPAFDPHIAITLAALACGASLSIIPSGLETDAHAVAEICVTHGITLMDQVPSLIELYAPELVKRRNSLKLRTLIFGGEPLPCSVAAELQKIPGLSDGIYNAYGPAEFTVSATAALMLPGVPDAPLGPPDPNVRAYVVSPENINEQKPIGAIGELLLSGPRTALGYINNEEQTRKQFVPNPFFTDDSPVSDSYKLLYRTGDLVSRDESGVLYFHGRFDGQIKINGVRIEVSEVKHVVQSHPEVDLAYALALQVDSSKSKQLVAFVTPVNADKDSIREFCTSKLIPAAVPSNIICLDRFPLTATGKINAIELERIAKEEKHALKSSETWYVPPQTSTEEVVADTLKEILRYPDDISVEANFFELGGNSLQAGILSSRLRVHFDIESLPATLVYQKKTIRGISQSIDERKSRQESTTANPAATKATDRLQADKELFLAPSQVIPTPSMPHWLYMIVQYIMLSLTMVMVPVIWGSLLVGVFELRAVINSWWLVLIWPSMKVGALFGYALLLILLKWVLVGKLKAGCYPLYGWMYARWVTLRALQEAAGDTFFPAILRTPFLSYILKALGAKVHSPAQVLIDSVNICDFDLLSFGRGCCIYSEASVTGAFVTPAGYLGRRPVLVLSEVDIGEYCHIGHRAVVTAGTSIPDNHNLKPHASRSHPGDEPVNGPLADFPHFCAEERLGAFWSLISGLTNHFLESLAEVPIIALCLVIIYSIIGDSDPLVNSSGSVIAWNLVEFSALFTALYGWLNPALGVFLQMIVVIAWKWIFVGRMKPGVNVARSTYSLFAYSVLRRQVESPMWHDLQILLTGTPLMAWLYKALGASVGRHVFIGGLSIVEFDALEVSDKVCSGSDSVIFATNADGIVEKVVLREEATIGNASVLYPGCEIRTRAVVGNDTPICRGRVLKDNVRAQGSLDYTVIRPSSGVSQDAIENGIEMPYIVSNSQSHVDMSFSLPWWHTPATLITLISIGPIAPVLLWVPLAAVASLLKQTYWWLIPVAYVVMVGVGSLLAVLYLRLLLEASHVRRHWKHGSVSVFDIPSLLMHSYFNIAEANIDAFHGTPFAVYIYRILGFTVGQGAILLCPQPLESGLIEIGEDSVIESGGKLDGHYMEYQKFIYHSVRVGDRCWVQEGARVMPYTVMHDGSRVMPASMVLPGDSLAEGSVWCGLPAEPIRTREVYHAKAKSSRILKRSGKISRSSKKSKSGFLDSLASNNINTE